MEPEETNLNQEDVNKELRKSISDELSSYMNPHSTPNPTPTTEQKKSPYEIIPDGVSAQKSNLQNSLSPASVSAPSSLVKPIIRTYKSDMEESIQANHTSSINIALAENKKMAERIRLADVEKKGEKRNYTILITSVLLVLGGVLAIAIPYFLVNNQSKVEEITENVASGAIITADTEEKINIGSLVLSRLPFTLAERVEQSNIKLGAVKNIFLTDGAGSIETTINTQKFFSLFNTNMPPELVRTLKDGYMFGAHNYNGNQRFLIFRVGSYENAFAGMLKWEVDLWNDFKTLFSLSSVGINLNQTGTIRGIETVSFQDAVYANKDTRVVKDSSGSVVFLYSIIDKNTVVITTSTDTLKEMINRNQKARTVLQ